MTTRSSTCTGASRYTARPVTSGSRSRRAVSSSCVSTTWASATQPQRSGESTRRSRLATKTITATTPRMPSVVATSVDRTGTAVRPRPACSAMRVPTTVVGGAPRVARRAATAFVRSAGACRRRRDGPDTSATTTSRPATTGNPSPRIATFTCQPGDGSSRAMLPSGSSAPSAVATASATTVPRATNGTAVRRRAARIWRDVTPTAPIAGRSGSTVAWKCRRITERDAEEAGRARHTPEDQQADVQDARRHRDHRALAARDLHLDALELLGTLRGRAPLPDLPHGPREGGKTVGPVPEPHEDRGKGDGVSRDHVSEGRGSVGVDRIDAAIDGAPSDADDPRPQPGAVGPAEAGVELPELLGGQEGQVHLAADPEPGDLGGVLGEDDLVRPARVGGTTVDEDGCEQTSRPRLGQPEDPEVPAFAVDLGDARGRDHRRLDLGQLDDPPRLVAPAGEQEDGVRDPRGAFQALVRGGRAARELDRADHESRRHPGEHAQEDHRAERLPELGACEQADRGHPRHQRTAAHLLPGGQPVERGRAGLTEARRPTPPTAPPRRRATSALVRPLAFSGR